MTLKSIGSVAALLSLVVLGLAPAVLAAPISPTLSWTSLSVPLGATNTATVSVNIDSDCPSGQTYQGTLTVVEPDGVSTGTFAVGPTACGTPATAVYPTAFSGTAGTLQTGVYTATWAGTTSLLVGGQHPTFSVTDYFGAPVFPPPVPEFPAPAILVGALGLVLLAALRKGKLLKI